MTGLRKLENGRGCKENLFPIHDALNSGLLQAFIRFFAWPTPWSSYCFCDCG